MHDNYQINHFIEVIFSQKKNIFQCYHKYHFIFIYITESTENEICCFEHIFGFYFLSCSLFVWNCIFKLCFSVILIHVNLRVLLVKNYPFGEVPFSKVNSIFYGWLSDCRKFGTLKVTKPCIYIYIYGRRNCPFHSHCKLSSVFIIYSVADVFDKYIMRIWKCKNMFVHDIDFSKQYRLFISCENTSSFCKQAH